MALNTADKRDHCLDAERAVVGSMLIDPGIVRDVLARVQEADFLNPANLLIFRTARTMFREGVPAEAITIRGRIGMQYSDYMLQLMEITPTSANWSVYAEQMHSEATVRRVHDLADKLASTVLGQLLSAGVKADAWTMREMLEDFFTAQDPDTPPVEYITCGVCADVDRHSYVELGDVLVLGGYPSDGKTALALMMAYHMAASHKVGFFSLETDKRKLRDRMVSSVAQIDFDAIKRRRLKDQDWAALAEKSTEMSGRDLTVLRASGMTAAAIQSLSEAYDFDVIFVDYVQLVTPEVDRKTPRSEQMADVSRSFHTFAQNSGTLVVELAQLVRPDKSGGWRAPIMQDLKESGQFEQDADIIYMIYRPNPKEKLDQDKTRMFSVVKNKEGPRGVCTLYFDGPRQTFSVLADADGKSVMRRMVDAGRSARAKNHAESMEQQALPAFSEITNAAEATQAASVFPEVRIT